MSPSWDQLSAEKQELFARYMELYAGLVDNIDQNVGRVVEFLRQSGQLDNTILVISSDNGASAVGDSALATFRTPQAGVRH